MTKSGARLTSAILVVTCVAALYYLPFLFTLPCMLAWAFVSIGMRLIDGYARLIVGLSSVVLGAWGLVSAYRLAPNEKLVDYAQYMLDARNIVMYALVLVGAVLAASGGLSLRGRGIASRADA